MNRLTGSYLIRSGARNLPIDPGMLRSRFIDETSWMSKLLELTTLEDAKVAASGQLVLDRALRVAILPLEHFNYLHPPFSQEDNVRRPGPSFSEHRHQWFKICEDGHEAISVNFDGQGMERLFIRDDWYVHAHIAMALYQTQGEGRLALYEFQEATKAYFKDLTDFFADEAIKGPFAVTLALQSLGETERFGSWFKDTANVRTLRPRLVDSVDDPDLISDFLSRVRQASLYR